MPSEAAPVPAEDVDVRRLLHELQVHQIELELQNEELARARGEALEALLRYTDLYDFAPFGYLTLDAAGDIQQANQTLAALLGVERDALFGRSFVDFVHPASHIAIADALHLVLADRGRQAVEIAIKSSELSGFQLNTRLELTRDASGPFARAVAIDITEAKRLSAELDQYRASLEHLVGQRTRELTLAREAAEDANRTKTTSWPR